MNLEEIREKIFLEVAIYLNKEMFDEGMISYEVYNKVFSSLIKKRGTK